MYTRSMNIPQQKSLMATNLTMIPNLSIIKTYALTSHVEHY